MNEKYTIYLNRFKNWIAFSSFFTKLGFPMDRNIEELNSEFIRLENEGLLTASARAKQSREKDYHTRNGITKKPAFKVIDLTKMMPPLHYWICSLNTMEDFAYIINTPLGKNCFKNGYLMGDFCQYIKSFFI